MTSQTSPPRAPAASSQTETMRSHARPSLPVTSRSRIHGMHSSDICDRTTHWQVTPEKSSFNSMNGREVVPSACSLMRL
ncbi:hypothetical protein M758_5G054900 [Ceratodon purpureus]|nr:hypothetical protein M758_5G054900 [Ceratodon purpureus]